MVVVADFAPTHAAEKFLCPVRASAIEAVGLLMVDPLHFVMAVQRIPVAGLVGVDDSALGDARLNELERLPFRAEDGGERVTVALADHDDRLALAVLVHGEAAIDAAGGEVGGLHIATEVARIDFRDLALSADRAALEFDRHGFPQLVRQNESRLVGRAQIAAEGEHALALDLVAEHRDGAEVGPQRQLVGGEQRPGRDREILFAAHAAVARRTGCPAAIVGVEAAAVRANRLAIRLGPAVLGEGRFRLLIRHAEHLSEAQGLGGGGEEEVLGHLR